MASVAVLITCFNRRDLTLECLRRLSEQSAHNAHDISVYLVDDGSTDGTGEAVRAAHPEVKVIDGDGNLFWNRGTHLAWAEALKVGHDHYLLLNDDTVLMPEAIERLVDAAVTPEDGSEGPSIAVGATVDPDTAALTYGGYLPGSRWNPMKLEHRALGDRSRVVTMNTNAVLVPARVVSAIGQMDPTFHHSWGDIDLGYRASRAGFTLSVPDEPVGTCEFNTKGTNGYHAPELSLRERIAWINSIRGLNRADWFHLTKRHGGKAWPVVWASPYVNLVRVWAQQKITG